jgi:Zn-dependent peptidase ImmA (M78 family)
MKLLTLLKGASMKDVVLAVRLLRKRFNIHELPINLDALAEKAGISIKYGDFEEEMSGFAYQKGGSKYIGVNSAESEVRQRFTIAHELGHIFLHRQDPLNYDPSVELIHFRDEHSTTGTSRKEIEANAFAAELLMPEDAVKKEIENMKGIDLHDPEAVGRLASKFGVSHAAITVRLVKLYVI